MPVVSLSSVGVSSPINLDWRGSKPVTATVTLGSTTMTTDVTLQFTLDDLQISSSPVWVGWASSVGGAVTRFTSANADSPPQITFLNPIAGLRLSSTAISASSIQLKVLQGAGW